MRTQCSRPKTQKIPRPGTFLPKTDPLEANDQGHFAKVISKKKVFDPKLRKFFENFKWSTGKKVFKNILQGRWRAPRQNLIGHDLDPFSTSQKIVLSSSRGYGIYEDLQAFRSRT